MKACFNHKLCRSHARSRKCISMITDRKKEKEGGKKEIKEWVKGGRDRGRGHRGGPVAKFSHIVSLHKYVLREESMFMLAFERMCLCVAIQGDVL